MQTKKQAGFTLIELMIVIAIIGILAAVALPAYQSYTTRSKVSEVILAASACRTTITEVYQSASTSPGANNWGCEVTSATGQSKYVNSIATDANGVVTVEARNIDGGVNDGDTITLTPYEDGTNAADPANMPLTIYEWRCAGSIDAKYRPGSCRG
ncbi:MAG: pilin [Kangiellaceae bacterium]|nr:pilin [Kangiellaceae bacterium]